MILLFTDFGSDDIYAGQVKAVLARYAPDAAVVDLLHRAPDHDAKAAAHLLAALAARFVGGDVCLAVVDPGVGGDRDAVVVLADGKWFVGPDNGLLSVIAARASQLRLWRILGRPQGLSASFHGRDLFAPICAWIQRGEFPVDKLAEKAALDCSLGADELAEVIYIDHYGNAMTGLRAGSGSSTLKVSGKGLARAATFSDVPAGQPFWYANSLGLVEIAANRASAAQLLDLSLGTPVTFA